MIAKRLEKMEEEGKVIRVGIVGAGRMGKGLVNQIFSMKALKAAILADINLESAIKAYESNGIKRADIVIANNRKTADAAIGRGRPVVTESWQVVTESMADVIVGATGIPEIGVIVAFNSITNGKHVVMLNVEADAVVGPILKKLAGSAGVVYTIAAGDQPGAICELSDWAVSLGFEIVAAGRGTIRYPKDREATPEDSANMAKKLGLNAKMYNSFRDGTKAQLEMAVVANATGLVPEIRGMYEPVAGVDDLPKVFNLREAGGILKNKGVVDMANCVTPEGIVKSEGKVFPGVFLVITSDHSEIRKDLSYFLLERGYTGPNYPLFRPYHLCSIETPMSIARAFIYGEATGAPKGLVAEVITVAKRDLKAGEILDGGGGFTVYGLIEKAEIAKKENLLPLGLTEGVPLRKDVPKGEPITYDMVELKEDSFLLRLRRLQDAWIS